MCGHVCLDICPDMRLDIDMCLRMCLDSLDMHFDMCLGMCFKVCLDMCCDMCRWALACVFICVANQGHVLHAQHFELARHHPSGLSKMVCINMYIHMRIRIHTDMGAHSCKDMRQRWCS